MISPRFDVFTGIGYGSYFYIGYSGKLTDITQRLHYVELPLAARLSFRKLPFLGRGPDSGPDAAAGRSGGPLIRFYLEAGLLAGILTDASRLGSDNGPAFYAYNIKPIAGLGILAGGRHRLNLAGGLRL